MQRASTGEIAEATQFNGRCGLALMNGSEAVAILYVEARGEWIARCYLTTLPGHLSTVNRVPAPHLEWANEVGIVRREAVVA